MAVLQRRLQDESEAVARVVQEKNESLASFVEQKATLKDPLHRLNNVYCSHIELLLRKPVNELSRGATVKDIVTPTVAITAIQAEQ